MSRVACQIRRWDEWVPACTRTVLVLMLVCVAGCVEWSQVLTIRKDGAGSMDITYALPDTTAMQMKAMQELRKDLLKASGKTYEPRPLDVHFDLFMDPTDEGIRSQMKKYAAQGLTLESLKIEVLEGKKRVRMRIFFDSIAKAAQSDLFRAHWPMTLTKTADGSYQFNMTNGQPSKEPALDFSDPATVKAVRPILNGFKATIRVVTPGEITAASASQKTGHTAAWSFDFDRDPRAFSAFQSANMSIRFGREGLELPEIAPAK